MKGKNVAIAAGVAAGMGGLALFLFSRKAGAAPPEEPEPGMAKLFGRVTDSQTGQGISGVQVTTTGAITLTDSNGDYATIDIPPGSWGVRFEKDGYQTKELTVSIQEGNNELNAQLVSSAPPTTYPCPYCDAEFDSQTELNEHLEQEHGETEPGDYVCPYCSAPFDTYEDLIAHILSTHPGERIPIDIIWD